MGTKDLMDMLDEDQMIEASTEREQHLRKLADMLLFTVEKLDDRFTLVRTIDVPGPVRHEGLSISEAEELLNTWKLRGFHGG